MGRLKRSYHLVRQSMRILSKDKELLLFPVLSAIFSLLAVAAMVVGLTMFAFIPGVTEVTTNEGPAGEVLGYVILFVWYFVTYFIVVFFNVAILYCAELRMSGQDPTVGDGLSAAFGHLPQIISWALVSASFGVIMRMIAERLDLVGRIISGIMGATWSVATYFVVPILIFEDESVFKSIGRSVDVMKQTWGEALATHVGVGAFMFMLGLPGILLPVIGGAIVMPEGALVGAGLMVLYWILLAIISSTLSTIVLASLYRYATSGEVAGEFDPEVVENAWQQR